MLFSHFSEGFDAISLVLHRSAEGSGEFRQVLLRISRFYVASETDGLH